MGMMSGDVQIIMLIDTFITCNSAFQATENRVWFTLIGLLHTRIFLFPLITAHAKI